MESVEIDFMGGLLFLIIVPLLCRYPLVLLLEEKPTIARFFMGWL